MSSSHRAPKSPDSPVTVHNLQKYILGFRIRQNWYSVSLLMCFSVWLVTVWASTVFVLPAWVQSDVNRCEPVRCRQQMQLLEPWHPLKSWEARQMLISPPDRLCKHGITMCGAGNYERNSFSKYHFSSISLTEK